MILAALLSLSSRVSAQIDPSSGGTVLQVYVLRLNPKAVPWPQYDVGIVLVGPMNAEDVDAQMRFIGRNGVRSLNTYYPPGMVQRIDVYTSPPPPLPVP